VSFGQIVLQGVVIGADGKVTSYVTYDGWGALTAKAVLKVGGREL